MTAEVRSIAESRRARSLSFSEGVAKQGLKDAYAGLKSLVKKCFGDRHAADVVLEEHEKDPETYHAPLEKYLRESGAAQDAQVLEAAQKLLALVDPGGFRGSQYAVGTITADRGGVAAVNVHGGVQAGYNPEVDKKADPS
jgi:hypothetical protein